jgi:AGZA family xanthine/uracil permease-like MFS transporter
MRTEANSPQVNLTAQSPPPTLQATRSQTPCHACQVSNSRYSWAAPGDVNAFFGLMLDNVANLLLTVGLLATVFGFPTNVALRYMLPGTAIGVLVGDLLFFWLALHVARKTGKLDMTAMPLGLDTPSTFGMVFFVLGPAFNAALGKDIAQASPDEIQAAAVHTWHVGICSIFLSGLFKIACSLGSNWIRRVFSRAGLLGSLAAIALVLISFLPLLEILHLPLVGLVSLAVILTALVARIPLPFKIPGALGSLVVAGALYYILLAMNDSLPTMLRLPPMATDFDAKDGLWPFEWLNVFRFEWLGAMGEALHYLPVVIPFALATVVGGIDCTESAAAAGDEYDTNTVIGIEAIATLVASLCGGVIQTTPYIGHPAYKAMGGRSAYTLATAIFIGLTGLLGFAGYLYVYIPKPTIFPILIFVGLEIAAQSFLATPRRHYPAVAFACVPALATLALMFVEKVISDPVMFQQQVITPDVVASGDMVNALARESTVHELHTLRILSNGFIVISLLWATILATIIDRKLFKAAAFVLVAAACTCFGIMHSPAPGSPLFLPWVPKTAGEQATIVEYLTPTNVPSALFSQVAPYAVGYVAVAIILMAWGIYLRIAGIKPLAEDAGEHL